MQRPIHRPTGIFRQSVRCCIIVLPEISTVTCHGVQVYKNLMKKLKLKATEMQAISNVMIEAVLAFHFQEEHQLPIKLDEKLGAVHELLTLADARTFDRNAVEDLIAYIKEVPPQELADVCFKVF